MADQVAPQQEEDGNPLGGLGALRMAMSGQSLPGQAQIEDLASRPVIDPSNKWLRYAAASIAPTKGGGFNENFSNALGAYAGSQEHEAELRAKYLPIIAQALLQRQQLSMTMVQNQYKLTNEWDGALKSGLSGLMSAGNEVNPQSVVQMAMGTARQRGIPLVYVQQWLQSLPGDKAGLEGYARASTVSQMKPEEALKAVSPDASFTDVGGSFRPVNKNPNSQTPLGPMSPGPGISKTLTPEAALPKIVDTPQGPTAYNPANPAITGRVGTPGANVSGGAGPSVDTTQDPVAMAANKKYAEESATEFGKYQGSLMDKTSSLADLNNRIGQMRQYTAVARTGATAEMRGKAAAFAKDLGLTLGMPQNQADALGNGIAGGDLAAAQAFQKLSVQGAMEALKSSMAAGSGAAAGRITQAEFAIFVKNNPSLDTDPRAMEKIHNFIATQYRNALSEQDFVSNEKAAGTPMETIRNKWQQAQGAGDNAPRVSTGNAKGARQPGGARINEQLTTTPSGRKAKLVNGQWEYE